MYTIEFYENANGKSELLNFLEELRKKTLKTPRREIDRAKSERDDCLSRS